MLRVFVPFATGICIQYYLPQPPATLYSVFVIIVALAIGYGFFPANVQFRLSMAAGMNMICIAAIGGMLVLCLKQQKPTDEFVHSLFGGSLFIRLIDEPVNKGKIQKATAELVEYRRHDTSFRVSGKIQVTYLIDSTAPLLNPGQELLIGKPLDTIADNSNPGGFDFREYSLRQGIRYQVFLKKNDFTITGVRIHPLDRLLAGIRAFILNAIRSNIKGKEEAGLAEALLIGYKNDLDKDLVQSYSNTGVVHVIAISGLHLALIYWIMGKGCDLLKFHKKNVKPIVVICGLWIFALLAGASPSVVRSAVMFTVIVAGEMMRRKAHILNSLAGSAFCLLCYNPYWLWDLGFQLSYIAVLSLVLYSKPINNALYFRNPVFENLWSLVSVTLAAQILTTPLTLMNFHKFPLLFLFTNCICVPLSSLLLIGELVLCSISWLHAPAEWVGVALLHGLKFMNSVVRFFERYPFSNFQPVQISILQTLILYGMITSGMHSIIYNDRRSLAFVLIGMASFAGLRWISFVDAGRQYRLIVYNVPGKMAVDVFQGRQANTLQYANRQMVPAEVNQYLSNSRVMARIDQRSIKTQQVTGESVLSLGGLQIGWLNGPTVPAVLKEEPVDILVVSQNSMARSLNQLDGLKIRLVIADGTNSRSLLQHYRRFFHNKNIPYHSVSEEGAFVRNLN
ncbi:MAG TPA: ComEC/Rec2 family competence protein [Flavitalea sp.]|nr:ComEC/Rec2 family competence protein [Flavitalea sp.]